MEFDQRRFERGLVIVVEPGYLRRHFVDHPDGGRQVIVDQVLDEVPADKSATCRSDIIKNYTEKGDFNFIMLM